MEPRRETERLTQPLAAGIGDKLGTELLWNWRPQLSLICVIHVTAIHNIRD
jgi:hypothetical protein